MNSTDKSREVSMIPERSTLRVISLFLTLITSGFSPKALIKQELSLVSRKSSFRFQVEILCPISLTKASAFLSAIVGLVPYFFFLHTGPVSVINSEFSFFPGLLCFLSISIVLILLADIPSVAMRSHQLVLLPLPTLV